MKIFTYYEQIGSLPSHNDDKELIKLWASSWKRHGWEPVVLDTSDAVQFPRFRKFNDILSKLPTVNDAKYELACYRRWMAMAVVGGGFMADYDVINYGFRPIPVPKQLTVYQTYVPSLVGGTADKFAFMAEVFCNYQVSLRDMVDGRPHVSDQNILCKIQMLFRSEAIVDPARICTDKSVLVHYSSSYMGSKVPKHKWINPDAPGLLD